MAECPSRESALQRASRHLSMLRNMAHAHVSSIVRRVVLLQLSLAAPGMMACGGRTSPSSTPHDLDGAAPDVNGVTSDSATAEGDSSPADAPQDVGPPKPCTVPAGSQPDVGCGSCESLTWAFNGAPEECGAGDAAMAPLDVCQALCPPPTVPMTGPCQPVTAASLVACFIYSGMLECQYGYCGPGRRPRGLRQTARDVPRRPVVRFLAQAAFLEAASVPAFERLASELAAHRAPRRLQVAALRAARDEVRHARVMTALAESEGATVERPRVRRPRVRTLEALAIENAVEGCVHETFAAAVAMAQSLAAPDARLRNTMRRIATDELRHAELAWRVARWLDTRLDTAARARVTRARDRAARRLVRNASAAPAEELVQRLGIPRAPVARAIALDLAASLWRSPSTRLESTTVQIRFRSRGFYRE